VAAVRQPLGYRILGTAVFIAALAVTALVLARLFGLV
jgi:hypothetical protein